jgi:hypothetical protein
MYAAFEGHTEIVRLLLHHGADVNTIEIVRHTSIDTILFETLNSPDTQHFCLLHSVVM